MKMAPPRRLRALMREHALRWRRFRGWKPYSFVVDGPPGERFSWSLRSNAGYEHASVQVYGGTVRSRDEARTRLEELGYVTPPAPQISRRIASDKDRLRELDWFASFD